MTRLAGDRRDAGVGLDRVVPEVRGIVREAASRERWGDPPEALVAQVVGWAVAAYHDTPRSSHAARVH